MQNESTEEENTLLKWRTISNLQFPRTIDQNLLVSILINAGYTKEKGGKGDHEKYKKATSKGNALFVLDTGKKEYNSYLIKSWLTLPNIDPQEFYWHFCSKFRLYRKDFEKEFGMAFKAYSQENCLRSR